MRVRGGLTVDQMALVVGLLAWLYPARTIRSQVLTIKERGYVQIARLSGMSNAEVIVKELLPNLLPYLGASLVGSVSAAILASIGLEVLGLGPFEAPTLGMTIYWVIYNAAIINGWWWWWVPPIVIIAVLFIGLYAKDGFLVAASYVPIASSVAMPIRLLSGEVALWEPILSLAVLLATCWIVLLFAEKIYRRAVMHTGGSLTLRKALKLEV
jgi:ABC-type Na+ efflux pump permease subunit